MPRGKNPEISRVEGPGTIRGGGSRIFPPPYQTTPHGRLDKRRAGDASSGPGGFGNATTRPG